MSAPDFEAIAALKEEGTLALEPDRTALIVIDVQRYFVERCRTLELPVYYAGFGSLRADGRDLPQWARQANGVSERAVGAPMYPPANDPTWQIYDGVAPTSGEQVVAKTTSGALCSTNLGQTLRILGRDSVVVAGVTTDVCVAQTARELADQGFAVVVPEDACAAVSDHLHRASLETFALVFGRVSDTRSVREALAA